MRLTTNGTTPNEQPGGSEMTAGHIPRDSGSPGVVKIPAGEKARMREALEAEAGYGQSRKAKLFEASVGEK
jgi:hypothetical protein